MGLAVLRPLRRPSFRLHLEEGRTPPSAALPRQKVKQVQQKKEEKSLQAKAS